MSQEPRPKLPPNVAVQLRQESGFGCAVCGNPIVEYHHIIEWRELKHFDPEHMVALCPTHHTELGKQRREHSYRAKANPINIRTKRLEGYLVTNKEQQALILGNTRFVGATTAISFHQIPLFGYKICESEIRLQVFVPAPDFWPSIEVIDNNLLAMTDGFWDIEFKSNFVKFRKKEGQNFLSLDFRKADVEVNGHFNIGEKEFVFSPTRSEFGGARIENITIEMPNGGTAIAHGSHQKLLRPNFAMASPKPTWGR